MPLLPAVVKWQVLIPQYHISCFRRPINISSTLVSQREYLALVEQCMDFAYELMDLCRGTQEVEAILGEEFGGTYDPMARLHSAIEYEEKKVLKLHSSQH